MKFAHLADCHIGSYRDERMRSLTIEAFKRAVEKSIEEKIDFLLISGDLFNTSIPSIDAIRETASQFKRLLDENIPVYMIAGSHDYSPSGKTMLDVLESSGLCKNIAKGEVTDDDRLKLAFTIDQKTGAKITGMIGKRGTLERSYYEKMDNTEIEEEKGFKIFMFHSAISELKPKRLEKIESAPMSYLPKGFNYYAGGHVHSIIKESSKELGGVIAYPGPLFPNSFSELEELGNGGFYIFDVMDPELLRYIPIKTKETKRVKIEATMKTPEEVISEVRESMEDVADKIILIRIFGKLGSGRVSDVKLGEVVKEAYDKGAYFVMRNTSSLTSEEFESISTSTESIFELEDDIIKKNIGQKKFNSIGMDKAKEEEVTKNLLEMLDVEKQEGETKSDFEERIKENAGFLEKDIIGDND